jgi:hypothetical protein
MVVRHLGAYIRVLLLSLGAVACSIETDIQDINPRSNLPSISITDLSIPEGSSENLLVTLSRTWGEAIVIPYESQDITAWAGRDYTALSGSLTIPAGQTVGTIPIDTFDLGTWEGDEEFRINFVAPANAKLDSASRTITILESDPIPSLHFTAASSSVSEAGGTHDIEISLSGLTKRDVTVNLSTSGGTATGGGVDYSVASGVVTIAGGGLTETVTMSVVNDNIFEGSETVILGLSSLMSPLVMGTNASHTVTILDTDTEPEVQFTLAASDVAENIEAPSQAVINVSLSHPASTPITVDYARVSGTATPGVDFTLPAGTLTFPAMNLSQNIVVGIIDDNIFEGPETIEIELSNQSGNAIIGAQSAHTLTILDNETEPEINFQLAASSVDEDVVGGNHNVIVTLSHPASTAITVDYDVLGGTATGGGVDYTLSVPETLTFAAETTTQTITIGIVDDDIFEADETILLGLSNQSGNAVLGSTLSHTVTIIDDELEPMVRFLAATSAEPESIGTHTIPVVLTGPSSTAVTVDFAVSGGTATGGGVDYTLAGSTLTFAAGTTVQNILVAVNDDDISEADETVQVTLSNVQEALLDITQYIHVFTIQDNDGLPEIEFVLAASSVDEDVAGGTHTVNVELSNPSSTPITVQYDVLGGTATNGGVDYTLSVPETLTFPAGNTIQSFTITIIDDAIAEGDETILLGLLNSSGNATIGPQDEHEVTITDDEVTPELNFQLASQSVSENAGTVTLNVLLSGVSSSSITVDYAVSGGTATGGGVDYTFTAGTLSFPAGSTTQSFDVTIIDDTISEPDETVLIGLSNAVGPVSIGAQDEHTLTILDNDGTPEVQFVLASSEVDENVLSEIHEVVVTLSNPKSVATTVQYNVLGGTATNGDDYVLAVPGTLTFAALQTSQTITIDIINDNIYEGDEAFTLGLLNASGITIGTQDEHEVTIRDDEVQPEVRFVNATQSTIENVAGGEAFIVVELSHPSVEQVTVNYAATDITATGGGVDYNLAPGTLTFAPMSLTRTITVAIIDDAITEGDETFRINLSGQVNASLGTPNEHVHTIIDDEGAPTVYFALATSSANEDVGTHTIVINLSNPTASDVTVDYGVTGGTATGGGVDYTLADGTLTFTAGSTVRNIIVSVVDDTLHEADETVELTLSNPQGAGTTLGGQSTHEFTIIDNDEPTIQFVAASSSVGEEDGSHIVQVSISNESTQTITVQYNVTGGSAASPADFTLSVPETLTFLAGTTVQDINIGIVDNIVFDGDKTIILGLSSPSSNATIDAPSAHTVTIVDDEIEPTVQFLLASESVNEDVGTHGVVLELSHPSDQVIEVDYAVTGGTANITDDYTFTPGRATFAAGVTTQTFNVRNY